ncbi:hypothetical protein F4859DRAFT_169842 [Xylaria cf. heliscus]|nr:hypothetical protein F4859DRAFT_169842 [Xylaria cf. heliscus]
MDYYFYVEKIGYSNTCQMEPLTSFLENMETFLGVDAESVDIADIWTRFPPKEARGIDIPDYLDPKISTESYCSTFWKQVEPFRVGYQNQFGHLPFMPPQGGIHKWDEARQVTAQQHESSIKRLRVYRQWISQRVL